MKKENNYKILGNGLIKFKLMLLFLFSIQISIGQSLEREIEILKKENDSLRLELEKCQQAPAYALLNIEKKLLNQAPMPVQESLEESRERILSEIKIKSEENFQKAKRIIAATDDFIAFRKALKEEMIERTGGMNEKKKRPEGLFDKKIVEQILIKESKAEVYKTRINNLREIYLSINKDSEEFSEKINLSIEKWDPLNYKGIPLAAFLPIMTQIELDAKISERAVLDFLNK